MTAEEKKKVAVDFPRLAGQGHPREMQGVLKAGGIHHNVYVQRGWDALLTAMEEAGKKPPKRPDPAQPEFLFSYSGKAQEVPAGQVINPDVLDDDDFSFDEPVKFRSLTRLSTTDMADALQVARARILRYLEKRGVITLDSDADSDVLCVSEELAEPVPAARFQANC